jgi:plasmid stability protein
MASITLKEIPPELHAQLKAEGAANFRSMQQEALARIERSFALDDQLSTEPVNRLIDDSIASGPEEDFSWDKFDAAINEARAQHAAKGRAR